MDSRIKWNLENLMADRVGPKLGLTQGDIENALPRAREVHADLGRRRVAAELPFFDLPSRSDMIAEVLDFSADHGARFADVVVLGIGGSSLGPAALQMALSRTSDRSASAPRLHFPDNVDPFEFDGLLGSLDLEKTLFIVISKAGGTPETIPNT